ncbi:MAG TPA: hypothetical protein VEI06_12550 [Gemmatimonadaceae bacterium]|nr:hypothetical protein [Gemmatimonadaceae bacterium]
MSKTSRVITAVGALVLLALYAVPLWQIRLVAPQYPEGLGMLIHLRTITGVKPTDLQNINGLNHYIGMRPIEPEAIPVLRVMPWIVAGLVVFGCGVALVGRRRLVAGWLTAFLVAALAGFAEFWWWGYDYGHNLAADAIIKVPGLSYQPPLLGSKQLLNFTATSLPAAGAYAALLAFALGIAALAMSKRDMRIQTRLRVAA